MTSMSNATGHSFGRRLAGLGLVLAVGVSLAACGDDDDDSADQGNDSTETTADDGGGGGGDAVTYEITAISYDNATAPAGGTIDLENSSGAPHTFTADDGDFDVDIDDGGTATVDVPTEPGEYAFHCNIHSSMQATLTVD
jgi:plastocyanin